MNFFLRSIALILSQGVQARASKNATRFYRLTAFLFLTFGFGCERDHGIPDGEQAVSNLAPSGNATTAITARADSAPVTTSSPGPRAIRLVIKDEAVRGLLPALEALTGRPVTVEKDVQQYTGCVLVTIDEPEPIPLPRAVEVIRRTLHAKGFELKSTASGFSVGRAKDGPALSCPSTD